MLDVLLQSDSDAMLPRLGLAVMEALSARLLELDDFEELITYLKVGRGLAELTVDDSLGRVCAGWHGLCSAARGCCQGQRRVSAWRHGSLYKDTQYVSVPARLQVRPLQHVDYAP